MEDTYGSPGYSKYFEGTKDAFVGIKDRGMVANAGKDDMGLWLTVNPAYEGAGLSYSNDDREIDYETIENTILKYGIRIPNGFMEELRGL